MKTKLLILSILLTPTFVLAQTGTPPSAGFTPQSPCYFLDRLGEVLQELIAFSPEAKIRIQVAFAAERIAELRVDMETKDVDANGLIVAQERLESHLSKASKVILEEKKKGKDMSEWEKTLEDEFEVSKKVLESSFESAKDALEDEREEIKKELEDAKRDVDVVQTVALKQKLNDFEEEKNRLENEREAQKQSLEDERERFSDDNDDESDEDEDELEKDLDNVFKDLDGIELED